MGRKKNSKIQVDYGSNQRIIFAYNQSITWYNEYRNKVKIDVDETVLSLLNNAGTKLYQSYEWALKNHLKSMYKKKFDNHEFTWKMYKECINKLSNRETNIRYLMDQMLLYASPSLQDTTINFEVIRQKIFGVYNNFKHNGKDILATDYELVLPEIKKIINYYIDSKAELQAVGSGEYTTNSSFYELLEECNYFNGNNYCNYMLITDKLTELEDYQKKAFIYINWSIILDFDECTEREGLHNAYYEENGIQPPVFNISNPEKTDFSPMHSSPYWFFVNGVEDKKDTIVNSDLRRWRQKYASKMYDCLHNYHAVFTNPIKVIVVSKQLKKIEDILLDLDAIYQNNVEFYFLSNTSLYDDLVETFQGKVFKLDAQSFSNGIINNASLFNKVMKKIEHKLPGKDGQFVFVRLEEYSHLEILFKGIADSEQGELDKTNKELFYQGKVPLSWYGAQHGFAVQRAAAYTTIKRYISHADDSKTKNILSVIHDPGVGGSTFAREIAFSISKEIPTVVLKDYREIETANQVQNLYKVCRMTIFILVESYILTSEQIVRFISELKAAAFPFVILYIKRKSIYFEEDNKYKLEHLDDDECREMYSILKPYIGKKDTEKILQEIVHTSKRKDEKTPFFMSLYTFDTNYLGIEPYIKKFLIPLNSEQRNILVYISIADYYADRPIDINFFGKPLLGKESEGITGIFSDNLVFENLISVVEVGNSKCYKMRHPLFAKQIIVEIVGDEEENKEKFANSLVNYLVAFIRFSKSNEVVDYDSSLNVLRNLFIQKNSNEIARDRFSPLVAKIKGMLSVNDNGNSIGLLFKTLVEVYPEEPHFLAHLARFYTHVEENYDKGIELASNAVNLSEEYKIKDALLYHIRGISLRKKIRGYYIPEILKEKEHNNTKSMNVLTEEMQGTAKEASCMFEISRDLNNKAAGYISDIEMCIDIIDFGKKIAGAVSSEEFINNNKDSWYMKYMDKAILLREGLKNRSDNDEEDDDVNVEFEDSKIQTKLDEILSSIESTVVMWEKYLASAKQNEKPQVRRFIARGKEQRLYNEGILNTKIADEIIALMEENIREEPSNAANIRIWFNAIRYCNSKAPEILLDEAIQNLSLWKISTGCVEAYYYYFILICIKAIEGSSRAEADIPVLQVELKQKSSHMPNNRVIYEWLGEGKGVARLINAYDYNNGRWLKKKIELEKLEVIVGRIDEDYRNIYHAYIMAYNMKIFFNPFNSSNKKISADEIGKKVKFSMGFSYDGLRAFNNSVEVLKDDAHMPFNSKRPCIGQLVRCKVLKNVDFYVKVKLMDFKEEYGSIHTEFLSKEYVKDRPIVNSEVYAYVMYESLDSTNNKTIWQLSMNKIIEKSDNSGNDAFSHIFNK